MSTETQLWAWMQKARNIYQQRLHMTRIENLVGVGAADVEGVLDGHQFWVELKCASRPKRSQTPIKVTFQKSQDPWHRRRLLAGGRAWVLLQVGSGREASRYLLHSGHIRLLAVGITESDIEFRSLTQPHATAEHIIDVAAGLPA